MIAALYVKAAMWALIWAGAVVLWNVSAEILQSPTDSPAARPGHDRSELAPALAELKTYNDGIPTHGAYPLPC